MMRRPHWKCARISTEDSPFRRGKDERRLGITIHASTPPTTFADDEALTLIRELVNLAEITFADTAAGARRQLKVEPTDRAAYDTCPFGIYKGEDQVLSALIASPDQWTQCVDRHATPTSDKQDLLPDVFVAAAHEALNHDLFVTTSRQLLQLRDHKDFLHLNICPPSEAVKIVGLFLRSRDQFVHTASPRGRAVVDSWSFYLLLTRTKLPRLWARSVLWGEVTRNHTKVGPLRESVFLRSRRAIEARDAIGIQFYLRQSNRTQDVILYHFDYLTLLLNGALDALMHIARVIYSVKIDPWEVGFWRKEFRKGLKRAAPQLHALFTTDRTEALRTLLAAPRNTIHGARLRSMGFETAGHPPIALVKFDDAYGLAAWQAAEQLGGLERWGLLQFPGFPFEPYSYTHALLDECFQLIQDAFEIIEVHWLATAPTQPSASKIPEMFTPDQVRRIGLLG